MPRHMHIEAGGDPAQGPVRELANEPPAPRDENEFPDAPKQHADDEQREGDAAEPLHDGDTAT